jgi:hypothetical protein
MEESFSFKIPFSLLIDHNLLEKIKEIAHMRCVSKAAVARLALRYGIDHIINEVSENDEVYDK